ncbi:MAG: MerR family transcriptional regulator [Lactobacillales bacterium]|jgi:DNA-binding transcriptional MerR regulator|nr:MerR family transcriptional regulator [Lactobacillales bacterium]
MSENKSRRLMPVLPIGTMIKLTDLSARQIRYYEEQHLIHPKRSEGNRRLYSLKDIDVLLEIKDYLAEGLNMAGIRHLLEEKWQAEKTAQELARKALTDEDVRRIFRDEFFKQGGFVHEESHGFGSPRLL